MPNRESVERPNKPGTPEDPRADLAFAVLTFGSLLLAALAWVAFPVTVGMLLISALVAYAVLPLVDRVARFMPRTLAVVVVALGFVGTLVLIVGAVASSVTGELSQVGSQMSRLPGQLDAAWARVAQWLPERFATFISGSVQRVAGSLPEGGAMAEWAKRLGSGATAVVTALLFVPIFVFLMLRGYHSLVGSVHDWLPPRWRATFADRGHVLDRAMSGFVRGQLTVAGVISVLYSVGFLIIGLPLAVAVGIVAGLGELIPYLGGALALTLGVVLAIGSGEPMTALWVVVVFTVVQALEGGLISPWVVGRNARLGAITVLVALAVGGQLFGFLGLLLAVPGAVIVKSSWRAAGAAWRGSRFYWRNARS